MILERTLLSKSSTLRPLTGPLFHCVLYLSNQMTTQTLLRKVMPNGYLSTWRFATTADGRFFAVSNRGMRKDFPSAYAQDQCIGSYTKYGYKPFEGTTPVVRQDKQLAIAV